VKVPSSLSFLFTRQISKAAMTSLSTAEQFFSRTRRPSRALSFRSLNRGHEEFKRPGPLFTAFRPPNSQPTLVYEHCSCPPAACFLFFADERNRCLVFPASSFSVLLVGVGSHLLAPSTFAFFSSVLEGDFPLGLVFLGFLPTHSHAGSMPEARQP